MRWRKYIDFDVIHLLVGAIVGMGLSSCQPEMPVISTITVEADGLTVPVNPDLYGLTIEEINHGIDGGLYAELIQNRSFEDGVPPLNCPYDAARNVLITPNGWTIPFMRGDSVPGWRRIVPNTQIPGDTDPERGTIRSLVFRQGGEYGAPYHPGGLGGLDG